MKDTISLSECKPRHLYRLMSRNLSIGVFDASNNGFIGIREKFGSRYLDTEYHRDTGAPHGTASPYEDLGSIPDEIQIREDEPAIDQETERQLGLRRDRQDPKVWSWHYLDTEERFDGIPYRPLFDFLERVGKPPEAGSG
ncbi:MAG: hypothetical protein ACRDK3_02890 [Actinomycetota bacterium]